jgi:GNAT superfamily N-acetyltransferase
MNVIVRKAGKADVTRISNMVKDVFNRDVAPGFDREGIRTFMDFIEPENMAGRMTRDHWGLVAENEEGLMVGILFFKGRSHINLFFVRNGYQKRGIGRKLLKKSIERLRKLEPGIGSITVNSAPGAVSAYAKMGFKRTGEERVLNGIRFSPMELIIS